MNRITRAAFGTCLTFLGMVGLYMGIDYSGWVLAVGLVVAFFAL